MKLVVQMASLVSLVLTGASPALGAFFRVTDTQSGREFQVEADQKPSETELRDYIAPYYRSQGAQLRKAPFVVQEVDARTPDLRKGAEPAPTGGQALAQRPPSSYAPARRATRDLRLALCVFGTIAVGIGAALIYIFRGTRKRDAQDDGEGSYIRSFCHACGGPIEFPAHGLGETTQCPHCNEEVQLARIGTAGRFFLIACVRSRSLGLNWKWASIPLAAVLLCGTALLIYSDYKAGLRSREREHAKQEAERIAAERERNYWLEQQVKIDAQVRDAIADDAVLKQSKALENEAALNEKATQLLSPFWTRPYSEFSIEERAAAFDKVKGLLASGMSPEAARSVLESDFQNRLAMKDIKAELQRANDLAENAEFQRKMEELKRDREQIEREGVANRAAIEERYQRAVDRINEMYRPQNNWVLTYDTFNNRWLYLPPGAHQKYNPVSGRYEWVPKESQ